MSKNWLYKEGSTGRFFFKEFAEGTEDFGDETGAVYGKGGAI